MTGKSPLPRGEGWVRVPPPDEAFAKERARALRGNLTGPEQALWKALRDRSTFGVKARRQVPFGRYSLDFGIPSHRLAIEVDGDTHGAPGAEVRDAARDAYLDEHGWLVLRVINHEVMTNFAGVLHAIACALGRDPHPNPLPEGEGVGRPPCG